MSKCFCFNTDGRLYHGSGSKVAGQPVLTQLILRVRQHHTLPLILKILKL